MASDLPDLVKTDVKAFVNWRYDESVDEESSSFAILQRGCLFRVTRNLKELGFCEDDICAVELGYIAILDWLTQNKFMLKEFNCPTTLYMVCLKNLVLSLTQNPDQTGWLKLLPKRLHFEILYFQELLWRDNQERNGTCRFAFSHAAECFGRMDS
ncbi:MAG: hypothetical protein N0C90_23495 [Candidatus Thiodiazotropha endolucinida]|nr:hypothetical protein [Candidatus Thiodiazotropha taylori]MCG8049484.1 hypothetical protein [Candidatus Thiodiazotropha taylori]MCW4264318.1 hypothetical protein [Candidatus Thiodiazotropha endolucinida]